MNTTTANTSPTSTRTKPTPRDLFATGWRSWCRMFPRPVKPGPKQDGWDAAAHENDHGGGARPTCSEATIEAERRYPTPDDRMTYTVNRCASKVGTEADEIDRAVYSLTGVAGVLVREARAEADNNPIKCGDGLDAGDHQFRMACGAMLLAWFLAAFGAHAATRTERIKRAGAMIETLATVGYGTEGVEPLRVIGRTFEEWTEHYLELVEDQPGCVRFPAHDWVRACHDLRRAHDNARGAGVTL